MNRHHTVEFDLQHCDKQQRDGRPWSLLKAAKCGRHTEGGQRLKTGTRRSHQASYCHLRSLSCHHIKREFIFVFFESFFDFLFPLAFHWLDLTFNLKHQWNSIESRRPSIVQYFIFFYFFIILTSVRGLYFDRSLYFYHKTFHLAWNKSMHTTAISKHATASCNTLVSLE